MNLEKRNFKMLNLVSIIVLVALLLIAFGGFMAQRQTLPSKDAGMRSSGITHSLLLPESAQSGPTGKLVMSTGMVLLMIGSAAIVVLFFIRNKSIHRNFS